MKEEKSAYSRAQRAAPAVSLTPGAPWHEYELVSPRTYGIFLLCAAAKSEEKNVKLLRMVDFVINSYSNDAVPAQKEPE